MDLLIGKSCFIFSVFSKIKKIIIKCLAIIWYIIWYIHQHYRVDGLRLLRNLVLTVFQNILFPVTFFKFIDSKITVLFIFLEFIGALGQGIFVFITGSFKVALFHVLSMKVILLKPFCIFYGANLHQVSLKLIWNWL